LLIAVGNVECTGAEDRFGRPDRLKELRTGGRRVGNNVEFLVPPVARHLAAARIGVIGRADSAEQHLFARHAELETERTVAVVRVEPIVRRAKDESSGGQDSLVSRAGDLKEDLVLSL